VQLSGLAASVRRWWWTLLAATMWAGLVSYVVTQQVPRTYESKATLLVGPLNGDLDTFRAAGQLASTYADLVTSQPVLRAAATDLEGTDVARLAAATAASSDPVTRLLTIRVRTGDPRSAATIANVVANNLVAYVRENMPPTLPVAPGTAAQVSGDGVRIVNGAVANPVPVAPAVSLIVIFSAAAGLLGALALVLLIDYFGQTISSEREVGQLASIRLLGAVEHWRARQRDIDPFVVEAVPDSRNATAYRLVASQVVRTNPEKLTSVLVVGTDGDPGSGEVAANLAAAVAADGRQVALIDANEQQAEVTELLGLQHYPGLYDLLGRDWSHNGEGPEALLIRRPSGLIVLPAGHRDGTVHIDHIPHLIRRLLAGPAEVVVTAGPSAEDDPAAVMWARHADSTVLVARRNATRRDDFARAAEALHRVGGNLVGAVLYDQRGIRARSTPGRRMRSPFHDHVDFAAKLSH
jgi:capsular polysaccharide biosynthesis protein/Mrp family chromosome partitioning ATPase